MSKMSYKFDYEYDWVDLANEKGMLKLQETDNIYSIYDWLYNESLETK